MSLDPELKSKFPTLFLLSFSTFFVCVPAAFTQVISFDLMLELNAFPSKDYMWTFPAFVAGECASMALCVCLIDRWGRKQPYLLGSYIFIIATAVCALCTDMKPFILFRGIQGFGAGFIIIACIAQIYFDVPNHKFRYAANGIMSLGFGAGMLVGIFAGRMAVDTIGWQTVFWIIMVLQAVVTYPCAKILARGGTSDMKADVPGAIILSVWVTVFVLLLQKVSCDWYVLSVEAIGGFALIIALLLLFFLVEVRNPHSVLHRKLHRGHIMLASMIFIIILGAIDMGAVGCMVKIALFTYQMSVLEAAPFFVVLVLGAATTAIAISKKIDETGHLVWLLLSGILSPIALLSVFLVKPDDPSFMFALHLFILGLAIGCLVSMLNATIQNRTNKHNNGAYISIAIMGRTAALWLGYNFYTGITNMYMAEKIGDTVKYWNSVLPVDLPYDTSLANLLVTPLREVIMLIPGLDVDIASIFADGAAVALMWGAIIFFVVAIPTALLLFGKERVL